MYREFSLIWEIPDYRLEQEEQAIEDYDEAIRLDPQDANNYYNRGNAYSELGQHQRAIEDFDEVIRLNPVKRGYILLS